MRFCSFLMLLLLAIPAWSNEPLPECPDIGEIGRMRLGQIDSLSFEQCSPEHMLLIIGGARYMVADSSYDLQDRGEMCYGLVADEIQRRKEAGTLDLHAPGLFVLVEQLADRQYHLALTPPSDAEKLVRYLQEGRWGYVAQRFVDRGLHIYLIVMLVGGIGFLFYRKNRKSKA